MGEEQRLQVAIAEEGTHLLAVEDMAAMARVPLTSVTRTLSAYPLVDSLTWACCEHSGLRPWELLLRSACQAYPSLWEHRTAVFEACQCLQHLLNSMCCVW